MPEVVSAATTIEPASCVHGVIHVPGDKSISHRYAILAALSDGTSTIENYAPGADCASTLQCLRALGVKVDGPTARGSVTIDGVGLGGLRPAAESLDAGNSGTTMRLMAGVLAGHDMTTSVTGDESLRRRPMQRIVEPLEQMGATVQTLAGFPPLAITGGPLHGVRYQPSVASAQVKSAVLFAGLHASGDTWVCEPTQTRDHTERALPVFGGRLLQDNDSVGVSGGGRLNGANVAVPGDCSSAAFWLIAAAVLPDSFIEITDLGLNPSRIRVLDILRYVGARVDVTMDSLDHQSSEPVGSVRVEADGLRPLEIASHDVPALIDELPVLAALGVYGGGLIVRGATELRAKESDRIAVLVAGLRRMGVRVDELPDGFRVFRGARPEGGTVDAGGDHRMAMAFAIIALGCQNPTTITGHEAVSVSYPGFFDVLSTLRR